MKIISVFLIFSINIFCIYYSLIFSVLRSNHFQIVFLKAAAFQIFIDVLIYESFQCLIVYIAIPLIISDKVIQACNIFRQNSKMVSDDAVEKGDIEFDCTRFLFTSTALAVEDREHPG